MIRLQRRFRSTKTENGLRLKTAPGRRIQFGISAAILIGGILAGAATGGLTGAAPAGMVFYGLLVLVCIWVAAYSVSLDIDGRTKRIVKAASLFAVLELSRETIEYDQSAEIRIISVSLFPDGRRPSDEGFRGAQKRARGRYMAKLLIRQAGKDHYVDESSSPEEISVLAEEISKATGLAIERVGE